MQTAHQNVRRRSSFTFPDSRQSQGVRALLSVGGWTGSLYFSSAVATDANRTAFAQAIMDVVSQYSLDGVEFECALHSTFLLFFSTCSPIHSWEYPNKQGIGCNVISANDSANFLSFLQILRGQNGAQNLTLSAAVGVTPFLDSTGTPMSDVSGFANVLDYIGPPSPTTLFCSPLSDDITQRS